uniref:Protein N-terminal glutamine amidohydrolase n=1 Tax=Paramoeba aestuarina TaxID=180227 RepID=A0A7S4NPV1_9EUKA
MTLVVGWLMEESDSVLEKNQIEYTSCFCEENIWQACKWLKENSPRHYENSFAILVTNKNETIPIACHSSEAHKIVVWDYHVLLLTKSLESNSFVVVDFDYKDPDEIEQGRKEGEEKKRKWSLSCPMLRYCENALRVRFQLREEFERMYRVIPGPTYFANFFSDRMHMKDEKGGWLKPPPSYPCINENNPQRDPKYSLPMLRNMKNVDDMLMDEEKFLEKFLFFE